MKVKTMEKEIQSVFNKLLESITDPIVRNLVEKNTILAGGSIASMFLREDVNDFDFYFRNKETVLAVCKYYVSKNNNATGIKIEETPTSVKLFISSAGIHKPKIEKDKKFQVICFTENAISLTDKVQLVIRFIGEPADILKNYDFMHVTNYWTSWDKKIVTNKDALTCLLTKELIYQGSLFPLASILRIRKFIKRGWSITAGYVLKMTLQLSKLDLTDIKVLKEQLTGVDVSYFQDLLIKLENVIDKEDIDADYVLNIVEEHLNL